MVPRQTAFRAMVCRLESGTRMKYLNRMFRSAAVALLAVLAAPAGAGSASSAFSISVTLSATAPAVAQATHGYCKVPASNRTAGAAVTVVCGTNLVSSIGIPDKLSPWTPIHGGAFEFSFVDASDPSTGLSVQFDPVPRLVGGFDVYSMSGTITSWRIVNTDSLSYIEFQIDL